MASPSSGICLPHIAYAVYQPPLKQLLYQVKYQHDRRLAYHLGQYLGAWYLQFFPKPDLLIPVPLHLQRQRERGFNQARELARGLASQWHIPVCEAVVRIKHTEPLYALSAEARESEMQNAFELKEKAQKKVQKRRVMLIDDIVTTGLTLQSMALELQPMTKKIISLSLARALIADPLD